MKINFSKNLKKIRLEAKMSQKTLAEMLEVDQRTVSGWENDVAQPSLETLAKICEIFNEDFNNILM